MSRSSWTRACGVVWAPTVCVVWMYVVPCAAFADDLRVSTFTGTSWAAAVAGLEADLHGEGHSVLVVVDDDYGQRLTCGRYQLVLDAIASRAFVVGPCDPTTTATPVTLVRRAALFDETDNVPRALPAGISAIAVLHGGEAGGAGVAVGSTFRCSIDVHPYIQDLEHGRPVFLSPGRYAIRASSPSVTATALTNGWTLATTSAGTFVAEYDVIDTARNAVVLHDRATLACTSTTSSGSGASTGPVPPRPVAFTPPFVSPVHGAAQVDGVGRPLSDFADLPHDSSDEQPTPWVRSRSSGGSHDPPALHAAAPATTEAIAVVVIDAATVEAAEAGLRIRAAELGADGISNVSIVGMAGGVHATALAIRNVPPP